MTDTSISHRQLAVLLLLCVMAYIPAYSAFFVKDDIALITSARLDLQSALTHSWPGGFFRPAAELFIGLQYRFFDFSPLPYHLVSISAHLAAVVIVYRLCGLLEQCRSYSYMTAALFALHPLNTETVSWISGQMSLYSALCILSVLYLIGASRTRVSFLSFFLLGLGFYENFLLVLPLCAALCLHEKRFRFSLRPLAMLSMGACALIYIYWRFAVLNLGGGYYHTTLSIKSGFVNLAYYLYLLSGGSAIGGRIIRYQPIEIGDHFFDVFTPLLILNTLILISYLLYMRRDGWHLFKLLALPMAWIIIALLPSLLLSERPRRIAYLAIPGYAMALSHVFHYLQQKTRAGLLLARAGIALYVLVLVSTLFLRNRDWQQAGDLEHSLAHTIAPNCREAVFDVPNLLGDALFFNSISTTQWVGRQNALPLTTTYVPSELAHELRRVSPDCYYRYVDGSFRNIAADEDLQPIFTRGQNWAYSR